MKSENSNKLFNYTLNIIIALLMLVVGYIIYTAIFNTSTKNNTTTNVLTDSTKKNNTTLDTKKITVEVLNGTSEKHIATKIREFLLRNGIDVIESGNYKTSDVEKTMVIDRINDRQKAAKVALILGLPEERISSVQNDKLYSDVSIVIGKDYKNLALFKTNEK